MLVINLLYYEFLDYNKMFIEFAFILGLLHNILLTSVFYFSGVKKKHLLKKTGLAYLITIIPLTIITLVLSIIEGLASWNTLYLVGVLAYLSLEVLFDWVLKKKFRQDWKLLTPFLILYFFANYALVMIVWRLNITLGLVILALYITQLIFNALSHKSVRKKLKINKQ